ncbi:MAG: Na(+)-translocating NADH-quinone reductase subunit C [Thiohalocapsa sp.]|nr:Na(+)-translocating NADH-quinone reductase subunit C [Thiohalocapsa sp.]MCF7989761.1 Na(+)-translocating NADH-quinone reductase subunit C [Thiohalocapsa sp.]
MIATALQPLRAVFALPNDDPRKTVAVALALCLACSVVVSATAVTLRPLQERNAALALKREVVKVAGLAGPGMDPARAFEQIETRLVDLDTGTFVDDADPRTYSYRDAAQDPARSTALGDTDIAGIRSRPDRMPVYLVREEGELRSIILPVYGAGLWSTMHGLLAVAPDGRTARGLTFYEQRETAGLGSEVASERWLSQWPGKTLIGPDGEPVIRVAKGNVEAGSPNADRRVDGLSGATLTGNGVTRLLRFWLGEQGYGPFLAKHTDVPSRRRGGDHG